MDGYEVRVLHGDKITGSKLQLSYQAIADQQVETFLAHYKQQIGTFLTFGLGASNDVGAKKGWAGRPSALGAVSTGNIWRYAKPPAVTQVRPGVSNISIELVAVLM